MILVPDLATDLGTPNEDFTEWKFTLRDGVKWETGAPVTADEVAFGIVRSMDDKTFPNGPGASYSNPYFLGGEDYKGPYTAGRRAAGGHGRRQHHHRQDVQAVPGLPRTTRRSRRSVRSRPTRSRPGLRPRTRCRPAPTRSSSTRSASRSRWSRTTSGTRTPTRRAPYPDRYVFKAGLQSEQIDQILLNDSRSEPRSRPPCSPRTTGRQCRTVCKPGHVGGQPCTFFYAVDQQQGAGQVDRRRR